VVLALCSYLLLLGPLFGLLAALGLMLAVSRYAFKVAALASRGVTHSNDYRSHQMDDDWKWLPWKFLGVLMVFGVVLRLLGRVGEGLEMLGALAVSFLIPAVLMVLINTCSLRRAINPFELLATVFGIGKSYLLLCLFLFLLQQGAPWAAAFFVQFAPRGVVVPLVAFAVIYFTWVMAAMIGYVMYQHHAELDIDPIQAPDAPEAKPIDPVAAEGQRRDADVAALVQAGDMDEALATAREWQRTGFDSLSDQRRYHRVLQLMERWDTLGQHAQRFIPLLIAQQRGGEALEIWTRCHKRVPGFRLESAEATLQLAQQAWKGMQAKHVLVLLQGFDRQHPGHALAPKAQELIVRALKQGENQPEQAVRVFMRMRARYPDHESTQEAAWVLRDELGGETGTLAPPMARR
jgi:hypothetical protein